MTTEAPPVNETCGNCDMLAFPQGEKNDDGGDLVFCSMMRKIRHLDNLDTKPADCPGFVPLKVR